MLNQKIDTTGLKKNIALMLLVFSIMQMSPVSAEAKKPKHSKPPKTCEANKKMEKITNFTYHQSGGFAAVNRSYSVKMADLAKEDSEKLEKLIEGSGLLSMKNEKKTTPGAADMFFYEFSAVSGGEHKAAYDDGSLPEAFRPLMEHVRTKATDSPRI